MPSRSMRPEAGADLSSSEAFQGLEPDVLADIASRARPASLKRGQTLFLQGDPAEAVFFVQKGRFKLTEESADGHSVVLRLETPGSLLGLIAATGAGPYPVAATALEPSSVLRWASRDWLALLDAHPRLARVLLPMVLGRLWAMQQQYRELATERVERRVARVVLRLIRQAGRRIPEGILVDARMTRQELAEMTGTTLFTVSRVLSRWASQGILVTRGRRLVVLNPHGLVTIAEDLVGGGG